MSNFPFSTLTIIAADSSSFSNHEYEISGTLKGTQTSYDAEGALNPNVLPVSADPSIARTQNLTYAVPDAASSGDTIIYPTIEVDFVNYEPKDKLALITSHLSTAYRQGHLAIKDTDYPPPGHRSTSNPGTPDMWMKISRIVISRNINNNYDLNFTFRVDPTKNFKVEGVQVIEGLGADNHALAFFVGDNGLIYNPDLTFSINDIDFNDYENNELVLLIFEGTPSFAPDFPDPMNKNGVLCMR